MSLGEIPLDADRWQWGAARPRQVMHRGRAALAFPDAFELAPATGLVVGDGTLELDLAVSAQRAFHGIGWHVVDSDNYESFFVRPHQVGNPDAIQYTPVTNGISSWQLYHGPGFWAPVTFPIGAWFTIRIATAARRAAVWVADLETPALVIDELRLPASSGGVGVLVGGPGLHVARFAMSDDVPSLPEPMTSSGAAGPGVIRHWEVSEPFAETGIGRALAEEHRWTRLDAEATGLVNLARASGIVGERNTVLARVTLLSPRDQVVPLELGFSDRATAYLNGQPLFRGDDTYRSRDYRFLGSIGYWDTVYLPLHEGANTLVVAVSETFGGWGIMGRLVGDHGMTVA
jgi:hypothetical protein